ncbi:MAG: histidine phosphatase family protein [Parachlamydiales bacterium]|nr:histidine phosphatase family protein [Parachlamydiales bacterium]
MDKLYLCRHGETEWTVAGRHTGRTDIPLTERGKEQALHLRKRIEKMPFTAVFSSPKKRALDTCGSIRHEVDPDICEWDYGDYEGKTTAEIHKLHPGWDIFDDGAPHGESPEDVGQRADRFLKKILAIPGNVAVFSHGHFLRVLTARYLGLEPQMGKLFILSVASLGILGYEHKQPAIILWNSVL